MMKKTAPTAVIVCASHVERHQWTSQVTTNTAKEILQLLCDGCQVENTSQLLAPNRKDALCKSQVFQNGLLDNVLDILLTRLESWPALHYTSHWCITQVKYPNLGDHLAKLLTLSLKLTDNHQE
ncbi:uncharacterized protein LOC110243644 [Exaiptasia diaphana]|uniref:Uncharacterized protein n=1 Tax=Exaiptasia diaphana TaxID=2652724 RepID=A0A913YM48_EXADI|nr:uncharacterized protein LOC110243644 [Exaiptasia diaphana]